MLLARKSNSVLRIDHSRSRKKCSEQPESIAHRLAAIQIHR
jgi:hypothetical protein